MTRAMIVVAALALIAAGARAQDAAVNPGAGDAPAGNWFDGSAFSLGLGAGVKVIDGDDNDKQTYFNVQARPHLRLWKFGLELDLDFDIDHDGHVREGQYDEPEDYFRLVRALTFDRKKAPFYFRLGVLDDTNLGYRTIVNHFRSDIDYERQKVGGEIVLRSTIASDDDFFGLEFFANNLLHAEVLGGRPYVRPLNGLSIPIIRNLEVGATWVTDRHAPAYLLAEGGGLILAPGAGLPADPRPDLDPDGNYQFTERDIWVWGADVGLPLFASDSAFTLTPYVDYSKNNVGGEHLFAKVDPTRPGARYFDDAAWFNTLHSTRAYGVMFGVDAPFGLAVNLDGKLERRETTDGSLAGYFDTFYEIERYSYPELVSRFPKRTALHEVPGTRGVYGDLAASVMDVLTISGSYLDMEDQRQGTMTLKAELTALEEVQLSGMYVKRNIGDLREAFTLDDQSYLSVDLRVKLYSFLYFNLNFLRTWKFDTQQRRYEPIDVFTPGIMFQMEFGADAE